MQPTTTNQTHPRGPALPLLVSGNVTIHRLTESHHGGTLRTLGHAAEYLIATRAIAFDQPETKADREALRILRELSRRVFDEYAERSRQHHPVTDWIMSQAVRVYGSA
jgi:hypothetical protein